MTHAVLDLPLIDQRKAPTIREYLKRLLTQLLIEEESFSGKRPLGNSAWIYDLYAPLIKAGLIKGTFDEEGYIEDLEENKAHKILLEAIRDL